MGRWEHLDRGCGLVVRPQGSGCDSGPRVWGSCPSIEASSKTVTKTHFHQKLSFFGNDFS